MALDQFALLELLDALKAADADDVVRRSLEAVLQALVDAEATARIGAEPHQRTETRTTQRNGYRDRLVTTAAGDVELRVPKVRVGSFFPSLLEPRRRVDRALWAAIASGSTPFTSPIRPKRWATIRTSSTPGGGSMTAWVPMWPTRSRAASCDQPESCATW